MTSPLKRSRLASNLVLGELLAFADGRYRVDQFMAGEFVVLVEASTLAERRLPIERVSELLNDGTVVKLREGFSGNHLVLNLKVDEVIEFPTGRFRFAREMSDRVLLLQNQDTGMEMPIAEEKLVRLLGEGTAKRVDFLTDAEGRLVKSNDNDDIGPNEDGSDRVTRARTFKFYVEKWDEDISIGRGTKALARLISTYRPIARQHGYTWDVQPARLKFAIDNLGEPGNRPLRLFFSRRGKVKRQRLSMTLEKLMGQSVKFFWGDRRRDYNDAFAHFRQLIRAENEGLAERGDPLIVPPKRMETLRRRINEAECHLTWSQKYSKFEADQRFRGTSESLKAERPGQLVIMDHTRMDNWVLFDDVTQMPLGRLTLTVAIDVATRCILGFLVSAEPPSLYSVLTVLKRVNREKSYVSALYPDIDGHWDSWCHVEELLVDNGWEFLSPSFQDALADLGTKVKWAPIHTPAYKAIGERFFHTLNTMMIHKLPNSVPHDPKTMSALRLDPTKDMVVRVSDLDRLMHQLIIEVYEQETHSGIRAIPARIWGEKIALHKRRFISDIRKIDTLLGRINEVTLDRAGIRFKNMTFHEPVAVTHLLEDMIHLQPKRAQASSTAQSARVRVKIKWNPEDCTRVHVYNSGGRPKGYVTLYNRDERFSEGMSFWHAEQVYKFARERDLAFRTDDQRWKARDRLRQEWEKLAPAKPRRIGADARRALAQEQATLGKGKVEVVAAEPTTDGWDGSNGIENSIPAFDRLDDEARVVAPRKGGKAASKKAAQTQAENRRKAQEAEDQEEWTADEDTIAMPGEAAVPGRPDFSLDQILERTDWGKTK